MTTYRETLHRWAAQHVPDGARVVRVVMDYDDGYDPTFTDRPESLSVSIEFEEDGVRRYAMDSSMERIVTSVGELLTELFTIEDEREVIA